MRRLTFTGFLESYVRSLAGKSTLALPELVRLSESEPRLVEPLLLWAVKRNKAQRLSRLMNHRDDLLKELATLVELETAGLLDSALASEDSRLRPEYSKVWRSYVVRRDASDRDARLKLKARERVLALETGSDVSRYRMAKDLGLNPGNLHAFLAQSNPAKLSLDRVMELVKYLEAV